MCTLNRRDCRTGECVSNINYWVSMHDSDRESWHSKGLESDRIVGYFNIINMIDSDDTL